MNKGGKEREREKRNEKTKLLVCQIAQLFSLAFFFKFMHVCLNRKMGSTKRNGKERKRKRERGAFRSAALFLLSRNSKSKKVGSLLPFSRLPQWHQQEQERHRCRRKEAKQKERQRQQGEPPPLPPQQLPPPSQPRPLPLLRLSRSPPPRPASPGSRRAPRPPTGPLP